MSASPRVLAFGRHLAARAERIMAASGPGIAVCVNCERPCAVATWKSLGHCPECKWPVAFGLPQHEMVEQAS